MIALETDYEKWIFIRMKPKYIRFLLVETNQYQFCSPDIFNSLCEGGQVMDILSAYIIKSTNLIIFEAL